MPGVFRADIYFPWLVDVRSKKNNHKKKKVEKWHYFETFKNHLNPLLKAKASWSVFKALFWKVLEINLERGRLLFVCVLLESFENFPAYPHYDK